jgi:hypothetical protein
MSGITALIFIVVIGTTVWVGVDSSRRDWSGGGGTASWVIGCLLLWIVVFPWYLAKRGKVPLKDTPSVAAVSAGPILPASPVAPPVVDPLYRACPHCEEPMLRDTEVCPHCQQPSTAWRFYEGRWWFRSSAEDVWQWLDERTDTWVRHEAPPA